jgi:hypothetical protein
MDHDVFISYASAERDLATAICSRLEAAGFRCWIAPRDLMPGVEYPDALTQAVRGARCLVLVFSADALRSPHVLREVELAVSARVSILTVRTQTVPLEGSFAYLLSTVQWLDALGGSSERVLTTIAGAVSQLLGGVSGPTGTTATQFLKFVEGLTVAPEKVFAQVRILEMTIDLIGLEEARGPKINRTGIDEQITKLEFEIKQARLSVAQNLITNFWLTGRLPFISQEDLDLVRHLLRDASFPFIEVVEAITRGGKYYSLVRLAQVLDGAGLALYRDRESVEQLTLQAISAGLLRTTRPLNLQKSPQDYASSFEVTQRAGRVRDLLDRWERLGQRGIAGS